MEILVAEDVAKLFKISKRQVYELTHDRTQTGDIRPNPLPCVRFGKLVRFNKQEVEAWFQSQATKKSEHNG